MKKIIFFLFVSIMFINCGGSDDNAITNDNNSNDVILIKKIVGSSSGTMLYTYNGNKLFRITSQNGFEEYTYSGDLITNVQGFNSNGQPDGYLEFYGYENGKLAVKKIYSNDELVESYTFSYLNNSIKIIDLLELNRYSLAYLDSNGNIFKIEYFFDNQNSNNTTIYNFDNKNSPFKNIIGLNEFVLRGPGVRNNTISHKVNNIIQNTFTWQYNDLNYPISVESFDSNGNSIGVANLYY